MLDGLRGDDPEESVRAYLVAHAHEEWAQAAIFEAMREMEAAVDLNVLPAMGRLLRIYG